MLINNRFEFKNKIINFPDVYQGYDHETQRNVLFLKINPPENNSQYTTSPKSSQKIKLNGIIQPSQVVEIDKSYFVILILPKGTTCQENIDTMNNIGKPFNNTEITRIGSELCNLTKIAQSNELIPIIHPDLVIIAFDGTLNLIAISPGYVSQTVTSHFAFPIKTIATLLQAMANAGSKEIDTDISANLKNVLQKATSKNADYENLNAFYDALKQPITDQHYLKSFTLLSIAISLLIGAIVISYIYQKIHLSDQISATETIRTATDNLKSKAHTKAKEWTILLSSKNITLFQQAIEAKQQLLEGDKSFSSIKFENAQTAYHKAILLYETAISLGNEIIKLRAESQNAQGLMRLSQTRWQPLLNSEYIELPENIKKASETGMEGEYQYINKQYSAAIIAYNLAKKLYDSVSLKKYNELLHYHQAYFAQNRATIAAKNWEELKARIPSISSSATKNAKKQITIAKGFLQASDNITAAETFNQSATLFESAIKTVIEDMGAKVASANAYEQASNIAKRWQSLFKRMQKKTVPTEITQAKNLFKQANKLSIQKKYKQSSNNYERVIALYKDQIQKLNVKAKTDANKYLKQAKQLIASLALSKNKLKKRLNSARQRFESLQTQNNQGDSRQQKHSHKDFIIARRSFRNITKISKKSNTLVYNGTANKKAHSLLSKGQNFMAQGEYNSSYEMLKDATSEFTKLVKISDALEDFYAKESTILTLKEKTINIIGPVAKSLSEIKKLIEAANNSLSRANELIVTGKVDNATQVLEDAKLIIDSLKPQAETELMNYALTTDSELRFKRATAALNELLTLNPKHHQAHQFLGKVQSNRVNSLAKRIAIVQGNIRSNGKIIPDPPSKEELIKVLGKPSRIYADSNILYDQLGFLATTDPESKKIHSIVIYYSKPQHKHEPTNFYSGIIEIDGVTIERDASIKEINQSLNNMAFQPTAVSNTYNAKYKNLRITIKYKKASNQIHTIGIIFLSQF